jgi:cell shape-determining protein MreC
MKKTFLPRRNALVTLTSFSWGARAVVFVFILLLVRVTFPNVFGFIAAPVLRSSSAIGEANHTFFSSFNNAVVLTAENDELNKENAALTSENAALMKKVANLTALQGASGLQQKASLGIVADVIARPPLSPYDTLVLAQGARAGIRTGMEAFGAGHVPLGVVESVSDDFSRIVLFSSSGMRTSGWIGSASVPIAVHGAGGGAFSVTLPRSAGIIVGDSVFVPGPGMLPLGVVSRIDGDPSSPAATLRITPFVNLFSIGSVELENTGIGTATTLFAATSTLP